MSAMCFELRYFVKTSHVVITDHFLMLNCICLVIDTPCQRKARFGFASGRLKFTISTLVACPYQNVRCDSLDQILYPDNRLGSYPRVVFSRRDTLM